MKRRTNRGKFGLALGAAFLACPAVAQRASSPAEATVYICVVGDLRAEVDGLWKETFEKKDVEIGTGSGFVFSSYGHVLTNYHVISDKEITTAVGGEEVQVQLDVQRIEVVLPSGPTPAGGTFSDQRFTASVDAVDVDLDLAVLSVSGADIPYIPFGDSDAAEAGQPASVLGFPFGRRVEVGKASVPDIVPRVSVSRGTISAKRAGESGGVRYLQTSATINPGNSGGPLLDNDGYALGVVRMRLDDGTGIGFAIPINRVKDFLETHGLDQLLPVRRLRLGPMQLLPEKGLSLRLPMGQEDVSSARLRVDSGLESEEVPLVIDRVASPWSLPQIEEALLSGQLFDLFSGRERSSWEAGGGRVVGHARGVEPGTDRALKMEYLVAELGNEKVVARYQGAPDSVAFNLSVFRGSLESLEIEPLLSHEVDQPLAGDWERFPLLGPGAPQLMMPVKWVEGGNTPFPCPNILPPDGTLSTSPVDDFTISLIAAWWEAGLSGREAAAACAVQQGFLGATSYSSRADWLGLSYLIEGIYLDRDGGLLQLEIVTPVKKHTLVQDFFREWVRQNR